MKHFRILLPLLLLALLLSACGSGETEPYTYTVNGEELRIYPATGTIVDGLDVYYYTVTETGSGRDYVITYPNGARFNWHQGKSGGAGGWDKGSESALYLSSFTLVNALEAGAPRERVGNPVLALLLLGLGALNVFAPEFVFHFSRGWMFRDAEPSDAYLTMTRIGGAALAVFGLILFFI